MNKFSDSGFTLIELLVVVAIIGLLSSVVLASLNTSRSKGNDAAIKADLIGARTASELYHSLNGNRYNADGVTAASGVNCGTTFTANTLLADANLSRATAHVYTVNGSQALYCNVLASGGAYAIVSPLKTGGFWCIDSKGVARDKNSAGSAYTALSGVSATAALVDGTDVTCN